jgi:hypothetical protein
MKSGVYLSAALLVADSLAPYCSCRAARHCRQIGRRCERHSNRTLCFIVSFQYHAESGKYLQPAPTTMTFSLDMMGESIVL